MIELKHICVSFPRQANVLKDISLTIAKGEVISIIGPSGSGKSTLIRVMNHLVKPTSGEVYFDGVLLQESNVNQVRAQMGMVFQQFELFPHLSVLQNIMLAPLQLKLMSKQEAQRKAEELLLKVNLIDKKDAYPNALSGGQKQRIAICRSLAMNPKVMLFDEPTSALDPEMVKEVLGMIQDVVAMGMTVIIVTHEMNFAKQISDRILFMDQGELVEQQKPDLFFTKPNSDRLKLFLSKVL